MTRVFGTWNRARKAKGKGYTQDFYHVHYIWKYRYLVPVLRLGRKVLGRYLVKTVPLGSEWDYLRSFHEATEDAIKRWAYWIREDYNLRRKNASGFRRYMTRERPREWVERFVNSSEADDVRLIRDFIITLCVHDTAYKPLFDFLTEEYVARINYLRDEQ